MNSTVFRSPHKKRPIIANLRQSRFQRRHVRRPTLYHTRAMKKRLILNDRSSVAVERIGWNLRAVAKHATEPDVIERTPSRDCILKDYGTESATNKRCKLLAVRRPRINGRYQN